MLIITSVTLTLLLFGAALLKVGWWPRREGWAPYCSGCGYALTGNESGTCPECGMPWTGATVIRGKRIRRNGLAVTGLIILLLGVALGSAIWLFNINWYHYVPATFIVNDIGATDPAVANKAWDELARRRTAGTLSETIEARLTGLASKEQAGAASCSPVLLDYLGQRFVDKKLTAQQADQFFMGTMNPQLKVRPMVAAGEEIPFQVGFFGRGPQSGWSHRITNRQVVANGQARPMGGSMSGGGFGFGSSGSWIRPQPPGTVKVEVTYLLEIYEGSPPKNGWSRPAWSKQIVLTGNTQVVATPAEEMVKMQDRPELEGQMKQAILVERIERRVNDDLEVQVDVKQPPANYAFDIFVRAGGKEALVGNIAGAKGEQMDSYISAKISEIQDAKMDVILRSSSKAARRTVDLVEAWKGEIVIRDVPVIDRRKK